MFHEQRLIHRIEVPNNQREFLETTDRQLLLREVDPNAQINERLQALEGATESDRNRLREESDRALLGRYAMVEDSYSNLNQIEESQTVSQDVEQVTRESIAAEFFRAESFEISGEVYNMSSQEKFMLFRMLERYFFRTRVGQPDAETLLEETCRINDQGRREIDGEKLLNIFRHDTGGGVTDAHGRIAFDVLGFGIQIRSGNNPSRWYYRETGVGFRNSTRRGRGVDFPVEEEPSSENIDSSAFLTFWEDHLREALDKNRADRGIRGVISENEILDQYEDFLDEAEEVNSNEYYDYLPEELNNLPEEIRARHLDRLIYAIKNEPAANNLNGLAIRGASEIYQLVELNSASEFINLESWSNSVVWIREAENGQDIIIRKNINEDTFTVYALGETQDSDNSSLMEIESETTIGLSSEQAEEYYALIANSVAAGELENQLERRARLVPPETIDQEEALSNLRAENFEFQINDGMGLHIEFDRSNPNSGRRLIFDSILAQLRENGDPDQFLDNTANLNDTQKEEELRHIAEFITNEIINQFPEEPEILVFRADVNVNKADDDSRPEVSIELDISETQEEYAREAAIVDVRTYRQNTLNAYTSLVNNAIEENFLLAFFIDDPQQVAINLAASGRDINDITPRNLGMVAIGASSMAMGFLTGIPFIGRFFSNIFRNSSIDDIAIPDELQRRIGDDVDFTERPTEAPTRTPTLVNSSTWLPSEELIPEPHSSIERGFIRFDENIPMRDNTNLFLARGAKIEGDITDIVFTNRSGDVVNIHPDNGTHDTYTLSRDLYVSSEGGTTWQENTTIDGRYHYYEAPDQGSATSP